MTCPEPRKIEAGTEETDSACHNLAFAKQLTVQTVSCFHSSAISMMYNM